MRFILCILVIIPMATTSAQTDTKRPSFIQWKPFDCSKPLMLPKGQYDASQFGKGKYRIDNSMSVGHFNNIYIIFQASGSLSPVAVPGATESTSTVKNQTVTWRSYKTVIEGRPVIRKEALLPNILPHQKQGSDSDYIWIRIDGDSQQILDLLTPVAEGILQDAA
jgi:hypothetical protein